MRSKDIDSILLMNKYISSTNRNGLTHFLMKRIIDTKIKSSIEKKKSISLSFLIVGFILVGRFGL